MNLIIDNQTYVCIGVIIFILLLNLKRNAHINLRGRFQVCVPLKFYLKSLITKY